MKKKKIASKSFPLTPLLVTYGIILAIWTLYRIFFRNWIWLEESVIKGAIFILPIFFVPLKVKSVLSELGISSKKCLESVCLGIIFGLMLGLAGQLGNFIRHKGIVFASNGLSAGNIGAFLILALITAFWEQLLFSGYFLSKTREFIQDEIVRVSLVGILFAVIHIPALVYVQRLAASQVVLATLLLLTLGVSTAILKLRQKNLIAPIMAHALWGVTIFLFR